MAEDAPGRRARFAAARIQLLATRAIARGPLVDVVAAACAAGVGVVQVREKEAPDDVFVALARELRAVTRATGALLLLNDRVHLVDEVDADGAHVGPEDLSPAEARAILGPDRLLGITTHGLAQARRAVEDGADGVGIGPVFPTETKGGPIRVIGPEAAGCVAAALSIPAFAIGGIDAGNVARVTAAGSNRVAVCAGILAQADPAAATRALDRVLRGDEGLPLE